MVKINSTSGLADMCFSDPPPKTISYHISGEWKLYTSVASLTKIGEGLQVSVILREYAIATYFTYYRIFPIFQQSALSDIFPHKLAFSTAIL